MPRPSPRRFTHALTLAALTAASAVYGEVLPDEEPLDFGLHLTRLKTDLRAPGRNDTARIRQIGISAFDRHTPSIQPGMLLGYAWIDLERGPAAALAPEGYYIGPAVRGELWQGARFTFTATASYLYQRVHDSNSAQAVTLQWYQPQLDLDLLGRLTRSLRVRVGATYGRADAEERSSGAINQSASLTRDAVLGGRAGLELDLGDRGQIGLTMHQAISDGVELYFQRRF